MVTIRKRNVSWISVALLAAVVTVVIHRSYKASAESVEIGDLFVTESGDVVVSYTKRSWWQGNRGPRYAYIKLFTPGSDAFVEVEENKPVNFIGGSGDSLYVMSDDTNSRNFSCISKSDLKTYLTDGGIQREILRRNPEISTVSGGLKFDGGVFNVVTSYGERFRVSPDSLRIINYDPATGVPDFESKRYALCPVCRPLGQDGLMLQMETARNRWKDKNNTLFDPVFFREGCVALIGDDLRGVFVRLSEDSTFVPVTEAVYIRPSLLSPDYLICWSDLNAFVISHVEDLDNRIPILTVVTITGELFRIYPGEHIKEEETLQYARIVKGNLLLVYSKGTILLVNQSGQIEWEDSL